MVPTAIPAIAPLLRPFELFDELMEVTVAVEEVAVTVESKSAAVTLKQGTEMEKSVVSTKYFESDEFCQLKQKPSSMFIIGIACSERHAGRDIL